MATNPEITNIDCRKPPLVIGQAAADDRIRQWARKHRREQGQNLCMPDAIVHIFLGRVCPLHDDDVDNAGILPQLAGFSVLL